MIDKTIEDAFKSYRELRGNQAALDAVDTPHFVCTRCRLQFKGETDMSATCPECGETYNHFFTPLIRCGTFALAYWLDANNPVEIRDLGQQ